jgi:hypothetical protein
MYSGWNIAAAKTTAHDLLNKGQPVKINLVYTNKPWYAYDYIFDFMGASKNPMRDPATPDSLMLYPQHEESPPMPPTRSSLSTMKLVYKRPREEDPEMFHVFKKRVHVRGTRPGAKAPAPAPEAAAASSTTGDAQLDLAIRSRPIHPIRKKSAGVGRQNTSATLETDSKKTGTPRNTTELTNRSRPPGKES